MPNELTRHTFTGELTEFGVKLIGGEVVTIWADGYKAVGGAYVFEILMEGPPRYVVEVARIPATAVADDSGMWPPPRDVA